MKPIVGDDLHRVHSLYYALCSERGWGHMPLPTAFDWEYLDASSTHIHARVTFPALGQEGKTLISIHPFAFTWSNDLLLKGLIHHELCHVVAGQAAGHGVRFKDLETHWPMWMDYSEENDDFARWLRASNPRWRMECLSCGAVHYRSTRPADGTACASCCHKFNKGEWSHRFVLHIGGEQTKD